MAIAVHNASDNSLIDNAVWNAVSGKWEVTLASPLAAGTKLYAVARDAADNESKSDEVEVSAYVPVTGEELAITSPADDAVLKF